MLKTQQNVKDIDFLGRNIVERAPIPDINNNPENTQQEPNILLENQPKENEMPPAIVNDKLTLGDHYRNFRTKLFGNSTQNENDKIADADGNQTLDLHPIRQDNPFVIPDLSREALMTDVVVRTFVNNLEEITDRLNVRVEKSAVLAHEWENHISALDQYIQSLKGIPWKKIMTYSACILAVGAFMWKMGAWRMLPDFASNLIKIIPTSLPTSSSSVEAVKEIPKPTLDNALNTFMHTPLAPLTIVTCIGGMTIILGMLKTITWILRQAPK